MTVLLASRFDMLHVLDVHQCLRLGLSAEAVRVEGIVWLAVSPRSRDLGLQESGSLYIY